MALTWTDINSKTNKFILSKSTEVVYKADPLWVRARSQRSERFEGGTSFRHNIVYAKLNGGAFRRGASFNTSYVETDTAIELEPKYYYVNITLFGTDGVLNRGPEAAMSLVESKFVNAAGRMAELLATDMYLDGAGTNSDTHQLDGMLAAFDNGNTFASYGGITRSDLVANGTNCQGINGYAAAMATFSFTTLQTAFGSCWIGAAKPDLIVTTQAVWNIFFNKMLPLQRFADNGSDVAKAGFQSLTWNGTQVAVSGYCPAGYMFGINTGQMYLYISTLPKYQMGFTGFKEAQNTDDVAGQYMFGGNFLFPAARLNFVLSGITA